jgi:formate C-acetyltransferase
MFGNDSENDSYTKLAADIFLEATNNIPLRENFYIAPGFYSLERDNSWKNEVGATPNGRKAGEPFSENQSPTYGADKSGITALLNSLSKLPLDKTVTGGLNLTFAQKVTPEILKSLVISYFINGGFHVGISVIDRNTLEDAMINPDKYKSLTVRLYGFSEYFVSLPKWQQLAVLNRTEYN